MDVSSLAIYIAAALVGLWGVAHLVATPWTIPTLGELDADARRVVTMEWLAEGTCLVSLSAFVAVVTALDRSSAVASGVYAVATITLLAMTVSSLLTGARVNHIAYRLCPAIFSLSAALIALGAWVL